MAALFANLDADDEEIITQMYLVAHAHCTVPDIRRFLDKKALDDEITKQLTEKVIEMPFEPNVEHAVDAFDEIVRRIHESWVQDYGITFVIPEAPEATLAGAAGDSTNNNNTNNRADEKHDSRRPENAKARATRRWKERKLLPPPPGARDSQRAGIASLFEQHYGKTLQ